jgi:acyl transferase domain-containing protein/acyl carrier protein
MAGRFPGAQSVEVFWKNLLAGHKAIRHFSERELLAAGVPADVLALPNYVRAGTILEEAEYFDADFFGYTPREAELTDPQHRVFLECVYEALQDAAYDIETYPGLISLFAGSALSPYFVRGLTSQQPFKDVDLVQISVGNERDSLASAVSYKLNLRGPSLGVQTFCSTSLVAVHLACQSLLNYESDLAMAGGVAIALPQVSGYFYEEGGILSPDGECRTFDAQGGGSVMGNGAAVVVLKRLEEAIADGDQITAVILGSHINNDGSLRVSYTAPGLDGQSSVIAQAISNAGVDIESIGYIEAHGTATRLGDQVELAALQKAFAPRTQKRQFCAIGSLKPNVGHLDRASGVTGLLKTALALKHRQIPPSLNFTQTSPDIDLAQGPFYVNTHLRPWEPADHPRRAGVSSFGLGGTNAHVVVEEAPQLAPSSPARPWQLYVFSAKTAPALAQTQQRLQAYLETHAEVNLADVAYTLQVGRSAFNHRRFCVGRERADVLAHLADLQALPSTYQVLRNRSLLVHFPATLVFPAAVAQEFYRDEASFRLTVDEYYQALRQLPGCELYRPLVAENERQRALAALVCAYALAKLLLRQGVAPYAVSGTGFGLEAAAALTGALSLSEAARLTLLRADIAAGLAPAQALHELLGQLPWQAPDLLPYLSLASGALLSAQQALSAAFWQQEHASGQPGQALLKAELAIVEIGPGQLLEQSTGGTADAGRVLALLPQPGQSGREQLLRTLGQLWLAGVSLCWQDGYADERRLRVSLPTYPFERRRFWIDEQPCTSAQASKKESDLTRWFYQSAWQAAALPEQPVVAGGCLWVFEDRAGLGQQLAQRLEAAGQQVVRIRQGDEFGRPEPRLFQIRADAPADYQALCTTLHSEQLLPRSILHCWNVTTQEPETGVETFQALQVAGFHSLIALTRSLNTVLGTARVEILAFASGLHAVESWEQIVPEKATLLGACRVIPQENLGVTCRAIDVVVPAAPGPQQDLLLDRLVHECLAGEASDPLVAYRGGERLVQVYIAGPAQVQEAVGGPSPLRQGGVYLITGGLGGVGPVLAEYLGRTYQATVVLMSRGGLPARETWQSYLAEHDAQDETSLKLTRLLAMEEGGGRFVHMQGDVGDVARLTEIVQSIQQRFGALHGVLHAAGVTNALSFKSTQDITPADYEMQVRPKVQGVYALEEALAGVDLDFCLLFSSIAVVLGGITFSAYVAGNAFLDAFVQDRRRVSSFPWCSINWDTWEVREQMHGAIGATVAEYSMRPAEACEVLSRVLSCGVTHAIISTGDLQARIRQWIELESLLAADDAQAAQGETSRGPGQAVPLSLKAYEQAIVQIWQQVLGLPEVGLYENFFDLGGNSLIGLQVISKLKKAFARPIAAVALYEAPTVSALARYLLPVEEAEESQEQPDALKARRDQARQSSVREEIAIIGMAGRFPGAPDIETFWDNLRNGVESVTFFSEEELLAAGCDPRQVCDPAYVNARPILPPEDVERFDALFFGYSPREAELTDPQHRLFLESAWQALEVAGYNPAGYAGLIGVFGGSNISTYMMSMLNNPQAALGDDYQMVIGNDKDSLTTSVSYKLNLKGPSFAVQTFCSTSLVAVHLACQSLLHGECDLALAGGVSIRVPVKAGHLYEEGGMESPDGHCRTFDAQARGSMFGDGVGIVVLKRLSEALADGDIVHAVIKGSAVNNDGSLKVSYTAPSIVGQAGVVTLALEAAGISPESISYIEAHGTATELGDPIEVASLTRAYRAQTERTGYCAIGSVKTNVGHLDRAAGVSGLIKTVLALKHQEIPANLHFHEPNPEIDFEQSPFYVNAQLSPWPANGTPRRAGINSLGLGGTNAHVIVEEAPAQEPSGPSRPWQLLLLSARTASALAQSAQRLRAHLETHAESPLADVAYTLQVGRKLMDHRRVLLCREREEALSLLDPSATTQAQVLTGMEVRTDRQIAFLFPGVGERYVEVARTLYHAEEAFRKSIDACHAFLHKEYDLDVHALLQVEQASPSNGHQPARADKLDLQSLLGRNGQAARGAEPTRTALAQPLVFVVEYALAQLLWQWGLRPQALLGYSLGEYVAACLAGVLSLKDALRLVAGRARLIDALEEGAMLAVMLPAAEVGPYLDAQTDLAIINSPTTCVLAGPAASLARSEQRLLADDIACRRVETTHAFHSQMLGPLVEQVSALAQSVKLHAPRIPYLSNVTGTWISDEEATDPAYWARHMCQTVRFADGVARLLEETDCLLLEVGPGQALSFFVKQHPFCTGERRSQVLPLLPAAHGQQQQDPQAFLLTTLGRLWLAGVPLDWAGYYAQERRRRVQLPTYPFERQRYWIEGGPSSARLIAAAAQEQKQILAPAEILGSLKKEALADWFYLPGWKHAAPQLPAVFDESTETPLRWLIFLDEPGVAAQLQERLLERRHDVVTVVPAAAFARCSESAFALRPAERADYARLLSELQQQQWLPQRVVHAWMVTPPSHMDGEPRLTSVLERGFSSLLALAQALGEVDLEEICQLIVLSNELQDVTGQETICAEKATLIGPSRVIAQEYPQLSCRSVDLVVPAQEARRRVLLTHVLGEVLTPTKEPIVALRPSGRWLLTFERLHLPPQPLAETPLRPGGTYLITGGLGGIGLAMAGYLARTLQANLVLLARSGLPAREQWAQLLQEQGQERGVGRQIAQVQALEAAGSRVLPLAADVTDAGQMEAVIGQTLATFGELHGVIHAAGLPGIGLMQNKTGAQAAAVMAPKLQGTLALQQALGACELDFLVLFSSITSSTGGGPGQIDYCAANAFLDAYALGHAHPTRRTVAINWGEWQWNAWDAGLSGYDEQTQAFFRANRRAFGIGFEEGAEALQRILAQPFPQVIVSTQDFGVISQLSRVHTAATALEQFKQARGSRQRHERPPMRNEYTAPQSDTERTIAAVWEDILGIDGVGVRDNFFDLGGNSLVGIELITQMRKALQLPALPSYVLYEAPSIEAMAAFLKRAAEPVPDQQEDRQERSDRRRESLKLRMRERSAR